MVQDKTQTGDELSVLARIGGRGKPQDAVEYRTADGHIDFDKVSRSRMRRVIRVDLAYVSRVLTGQVVPSLRVARKMAAYFGISTDDVCDELERWNRLKDNAKDKVE